MNLTPRGFWLRLIPVLVVIAVDLIFLVFLDSYFFINKRTLIQLSFEQWNEMLDQLDSIERELNRLKSRYSQDTLQYLEQAKVFLQEEGSILLAEENPWVRLTLQDQEDNVYFQIENLEKADRYNCWKNSLFSQSFVGQVGKPGIYLLVDYATPPGIQEVEQLAWRYKVYALGFVLFTWVIFFLLVRKVVRPLIKVDEGIERIIRTGQVSLIPHPKNEIESAFNRLMRTQREVFFSVEVDQTVDRLHPVSDEKEVILHFLQEMPAPIQKIYFLEKALAFARRNEEWHPLSGSTALQPLPLPERRAIQIHPDHSLSVLIEYESKPVGALFCQAAKSMHLPQDELERIAAEIKKHVEHGLARCIGRSRQLTEERNRFGINIATNMGHDLTNIIASGKWDLDTISRAEKMGIIKTDEPRGKFYTEAVDGLRNNLHFLQEMVDIYRSFAHTQQPRFEITDLSYLTRDVVELFTRSTSKKITMQAVTPDSLPAYVEPRLLRMTLFNLFNNAAQAIVQAIPPIAEGYIEIALKLESRHHAVFEVRDNGPGIRDHQGALLSEAQVPRIFQSGYSTKGKSSGGGLGLSWVRSIVEDFHHGSLTARNPNEGGAVFILSFPIQPHDPDGDSAGNPL